ncbi:MAG: DMT family transporter [Clostridia bacterium]|jgi:drug/metabolite transporter (DMT)-like permease
MDKKKLGTLYIFITALLFSTGGLFIKLLTWSPLAINAARSAVSVLVIGTYLKLEKVPLKVNKYVLLGAVCMSATNNLYVVANKLTTAANTILLQFTAPVFILLFMWLFYKEKPKKADVITSIAVFTGILFFFMDSLQTGNMLGNVLALASGATYAVVFMLNTFPDAHPVSSIILGHMTSVIIGAPAVFRQTDFSSKNIILLLALGVFQLGVAYILFSKGLEHTPPVTAALITGIEPILNPTLVAIFYKETMTWPALVGGIIVFLSIIVYNVYKSSRPEKKELVSDAGHDRI